jgi:ubiquinone/menaquinone biosynthesis C-methylase UbiE
VNALATALASTSQPNSYALDSSWYAERDRLNSLTSLYDETTLDICERLGLRDGWRCAEVGAGTGSVAELLVARVGPSGRVLAVDLDTRFLEPIRSDTLLVEQVDITTTDLPDGPYDLIHARLLLEHLGQRDEVLRRLARSLAPDGWLLIEDFDWSTATVVDPPSVLQTKIADACRTVFSQHAYDPEYGRRLPRALSAAGLVDVTTRAVSAQVAADPVRGVPQWELLVGQLSPALLGLGLVTAAELDEFSCLCHTSDTVFFAPLMISSAGRAPAGGLPRAT